MKKSKPFSFLAVLIAVFFFFGGSFYWWFWANSPLVATSEAASQVFVIQKGEGLASVAARLKAEGLIKSSLAFKILAVAKGVNNQIQAGEFFLKASFSPLKIAELLTRGSFDVWLTFPEGWRREEIARRLAENLKNFDYSEFLKLSENKEGFLFPDTYLIPQNASPTAVLAVFEKNFNNKLNSSLKKKIQQKNLTLVQGLTLASIVEREVKNQKDRFLVAGILFKRYRAGWLLQADATVQFALANDLAAKNQRESWENFNWWPTVKKRDLLIDSLYNTYQQKGLPPAPICNPGLAAIKAMINSQESDFWFYLSDASGQVYYARTYAEHNLNIQKYL